MAGPDAAEPRDDTSSPAPRTVLITGASSGVGRSLVHHLAGSFRVIAVARRGALLEEEFGGTPTVEVHELDLADADAVRGFCDRLLSAGRVVSHLVNNAGTSRPGPLVTLPAEDLEESLQVNAWAPLLLMQAFLPPMEARGFGRIVNVTSGAPLNCFPGFGAYSGSKALLNALTVTMAREFEHADIKINLMSPGPVRTQMAPDAPMDPEVCHPTAEYLLNLDADGPTGRFFWLGHEVPLFPELEGVDWLAGRANGRLRRVL